MARRSTWIAMAIAIPATVAFTPRARPAPALGIRRWRPQSPITGVAAAQPANPSWR